MPVHNKLPFRRRKPDSTIKDTDKVFHLEATQEVFTNYDEYFERFIRINSMCWTCAITGKSGMTFSEALMSEREAIFEITRKFPSELARPLLWIAHRLSYRGKLDDLVNDIYLFSRDRYFVGETVWYNESEAHRHKGEIIKVSYNRENEAFTTLSPKKSDGIDGDANISTVDGQSDDPKLPPPQAYTYTFKWQKGKEINFKDIDHSLIGRPKGVGSRLKLRVYFKYNTELKSDRICVKKKAVDDFNLDTTEFVSFFDGPVPALPKVPRKRQFGAMEGAEEVPKVKKTPSEPSAKKKRLSKAKKEILEQQESHKELFDQAAHLGVENIGQWQQTDRLLTKSDIEDLKTMIKNMKDEAREREKERRRREREEQAAARRPRDDLLCDDLKPLPPLYPIDLPAGISDAMFDEMISLLQFFNSFYDVLKLDEEPVTFQDCIRAITGEDTMTNNSFVKVLSILINGYAEAHDNEEGDEAQFADPKEMSSETNSAVNNKIHGERVKARNLLHEQLRNTHGTTPCRLPLSWKTITEVLNLIFSTAGYCPLPEAYHSRMTQRGGLHCFDGPIYRAVTSNAHPELMRKLQTKTVFDLNPQERIALTRLLRLELLTFASFRDVTSEKIDRTNEIRKQLKFLRMFDQEQEKAAKNATLLAQQPKEEEGTPKPAPGSAAPSADTAKVVSTLRTYIKSMTSRRSTKLGEVTEIMFHGIPYEEFDLEEITDLRELQKGYVADKVNSTIAELYDVFCSAGTTLLGRDRAFRNYIILPSIPIVLVENRLDIGTCDVRTPIPDATDEEIASVFGCTGSVETCPVHTPNRPRWMYLAVENGIDKLIEACNPRGFREIDLAETLTMFRSFISSAVNDVAEKLIVSPSAVMNGFHASASSSMLVDGERTSSSAKEESDDGSSKPKKRKRVSFETCASYLGFDPVTDARFSEEAFVASVRSDLVELEASIFTKAMGSVDVPPGKTRDQFVHALTEGEDIRPFVVDSDRLAALDNSTVIMDTDEEAKIDEEEAAPLNQLVLALLKIVHGVRIKFVKYPFTIIDEKGKNKQLMPTISFIQWQKLLATAKSLSAVALFIREFSSNVAWNVVKPGKQCPTCRRKTNSSDDVVVCSDCLSQYHTSCLALAIPRKLDWLCKKCSKKTPNGRLTGPPAKTASAIPIDADDEPKDEEQQANDSDAEDNNSSVENHDDGASGRKRRHAAMAVVDYSELDNGHSLPPSAGNRRSTRQVTKHTTAPSAVSAVENANLRAISTGLRPVGEKDIRKQLIECEKVVQQAIRLDCAYPFASAVNAKEAPKYYDVVKKPMDMRKMINKLKNLDYESPQEVWADFRLIVSNCIAYNGENSEISDAVRELDDFMKEHFRSIIGVAVDVA